MAAVKRGEGGVLVHGEEVGGEGGVLGLGSQVGGRVGGVVREDLIRCVFYWTATCKGWSLRFLP